MHLMRPVSVSTASETSAARGSGSLSAGNLQFPSSGEFLTSTAIIVAGLYFFREVLVPIAVAILLSFILAPIVRFLKRGNVPRVVAVLVVVVFAFSAIFGLGAIVTSQVSQLADNLPKYELTMREKISSLRKATVERVAFKRASEALSELKTGIERDKESGSANVPEPSSTATKPIPVEVQQPGPTTLESLQRVISPLLSPLETSVISIILVIFFLVQQEDLRNRFVRVAGVYDLQRTTTAIDDAGRRLSQYLFSQATVNAAFAFVVAGALWLIGIPSAILWGILAGLFRFVPYVGAIAAALLPLALAAAIDPGWTLFLLTLGIFLILEPVLAYGIEPLVYGRSVGLSPVAIVTSAVVWTSLWGPVGLLLSVPLTICLVVLGRHVERLRFLDILLSDQEPLTPAQVFYQRMLTGNADEASHETENAIKETRLDIYFDQVVLEALQLAQVDTWRGIIDARHILDFIRLYISNLEDFDTRPNEGKNVSSSTSSQIVSCVSADGPLDDAVCELLRHVLSRRGISSNILRRDELISRSTTGLNIEDVTLVCVSCLDFSSRGKLRYTVQRVRRKAPSAFVVAGIWMGAEVTEIQNQTGEIGADDIATTLRGAVDLLTERKVLP